ncbi:type II toxin-antitoxin system RelE/ParE family toxin [Edwardsiella anguillarum]|nr:type II toxin-antitoxin system RelE/ParE family toxin [Edwardsiella anguillarum]
MDTIPSVRSLKILNPKIWGYKGTIYKLRIDCGAESARLLFMLDAHNDLVVLHAFLKKTRRTPKKRRKRRYATLTRCVQMRS